MACPHHGIIGQDLAFTIRSFAADGSPVDADSLPTYTVYEENTDNPIAGLAGLSMTKDADQTGLYYSLIDIAIGTFSRYKTYIIDINAVVAGTAIAKTYTFLAIGQEDAASFGGDTGGDIRACSDYKGSFKPGSEGTLVLKITSFEGIPEDASSITVSITGPTENVTSASTVVDSASPMHVQTGYYVYVWDIPATQDIGSYEVLWEYTVNSVARSESQSIIISEDTTFEGTAYSLRVIAFRSALENHIKCMQNIPVYSEQSKVSRDNAKFYFSFPRWNQSAGVRIYRNEEIVNSGIEVNYCNGTVTFIDELLEQDVITADYNFRWFTEEQLDRFLDNALLQLNFAPPVAGYDLNNAPDNQIPAILYGAARDAYRTLMGCILFQEPAQVFGGPEAAKDLFSQMETLKQNYEKDFLYFLENKKYGAYPSVRAVVTPEYTLPGGRSRWFRYLFKG
jgi:hypothetical protein